MAEFTQEDRESLQRISAENERLKSQMEQMASKLDMMASYIKTLEEKNDGQPSNETAGNMGPSSSSEEEGPFCLFLKNGCRKGMQLYANKEYCLAAAKYGSRSNTEDARREWFFNAGSGLLRLRCGRVAHVRDGGRIYASHDDESCPVPQEMKVWTRDEKGALSLAADGRQFHNEKDKTDFHIRVALPGELDSTGDPDHCEWQWFHLNCPSHSRPLQAYDGVCTYLTLKGESVGKNLQLYANYQGKLAAERQGTYSNKSDMIRAWLFDAESGILQLKDGRQAFASGSSVLVALEGEKGNLHSYNRVWQRDDSSGVLSLRATGQELYIDSGGWARLAGRGESGNDSPARCEWHWDERQSPLQVMIDMSHEYWFKPPYSLLLKKSQGHDVYTAQVGLRQEYLKAFDVVVIFGGQYGLLGSETEAVVDFVQGGGGVLLAGRGPATEGLEELLRAQCEGRSGCGPVVVRESYKDSADLSNLQMFDGLGINRAGETGLMAVFMGGFEDKCFAPSASKRELPWCTIRHPDAMPAVHIDRLCANAQSTYELVTEQFGYSNTGKGEKFDITALACAGSGWQAKSTMVGIGALSESPAVLVHEFSNSLCVEMTAMGGDAGWSSYVQRKVKRAMGQLGVGLPEYKGPEHQQTTQEIHDACTEKYKKYERDNGIEVDPTDSQDIYGHGGGSAIISKWIAIYTHFELTFGDSIMQSYFGLARKAKKALSGTPGWEKIHDRMVAYFSIVTGEDQAPYFEGMGYRPTRRLAEDPGARALLEGLQGA